MGHLILTTAPPIDGCHHCYESKILVCYYTQYSLKTTDAQSDKWHYPYLIHTVTWINIICTEGEGLMLSSWYILSIYTAAFLLQSRDYHVSEILALINFFMQFFAAVSCIAGNIHYPSQNYSCLSSNLTTH